MKRIGTAKRPHVDDATRSASILRRKITGDNAEFAHRVQRNVLAQRRVVDIVVVNAVEQHVGAGGAQAVDVVAGAASGNANARHSRSRIVACNVIGEPD